MIKNVISDMDGVIYRGKELIPGAKEFIEKMLSTDVKFLFLTNNSEQTPRDLKIKLDRLGIKGLSEKHFLTSAMATAEFLKAQKEKASCYVIGGGALSNELYNVGFSISETHPDYVVVGKTSSFNFDMMKKAVRLIKDGAKFIGTNPDIVDPTETGFEPACGTILAAIEKASGKAPYIVGKPNPIMMFVARQRLDARAEETIMIGDRMDTDIIGGMEAGMKTCLVLSGVSTKEVVKEFPYRPNYILNNVGEIDLDQM